MSWGWAADGLASGSYADVDEAAEGLAESARRAARAYGSGVRTRIMQDCVPPLQRRMLAEAPPLLADGRPWFGECGGVYVRLEPAG